VHLLAERPLFALGLEVHQFLNYFDIEALNQWFLSVFVLERQVRKV
jgi:hypothetical protein